MTNTEILISNIYRIMDEKGLKQCSVAKRAGFTPNTFCNLLHGRKIIIAEVIPDIAAALDVSIEELYRKDM